MFTMNRARTNRILAVLLSACSFAFATMPCLGAKSVTGLPDPIGQGPVNFTPTEADIWKESAVTVPAYPVDGDLLALKPMPGDTLRVFVDRKSVSRAADRVLRLTLVVETGSGVRNVFYDGLRCETREYKTFAFGSSDKTLVPIQNAAWQAITYFPTNAFRYNLRRQYACDDTAQARTPEEFLNKIQYDR
jgi:hypothetical protein